MTVNGDDTLITEVADELSRRGNIRRFFSPSNIGEVKGENICTGTDSAEYDTIMVSNVRVKVARTNTPEFERQNKGNPGSKYSTELLPNPFCHRQFTQ